MMRKGRPVSDSTQVGPAVGSAVNSATDSGADSETDSFDPFESFDAHDRAAGRGPSVRSHSPSDAVADGETTYTRSRRQLGEADSTAASSQRQRPTRSLKGRALAYLSRREHSRAELTRKLQPYVEEGDSLDTLLDTLEQEGWLSDSRFTESVVHRRASRLGAGRIVGELKRQGVGSALIEETAAQLRETELARAQAVWSKKYGQLPETPAERARQARFLVARGFSQAIVSRILKGIDDD